MKFDISQREIIKAGLIDFFETAFKLEKTTKETQPKKIEQLLQKIPTLKNFDISCSFGQGNTSSTPYIAFKLKQHKDDKGVYPRVAMLKSSNHKIEVSIVESYANKVDYKAKYKIEQYDKDNICNSFFIYKQNSCNYEAIINKLEQDINFFLSIPSDELEIL